MRILYLTTILFSKNCNGGEVATQFFIDTLREQGHIVDVVGYQRQGDVLTTDPKHTFVVDIRHTETSKAKFDFFLWFGMALLNRLPYSIAKYYSNRYKKLVQSLLSLQHYGAVVIEHSQMGWILDEVISHKAPETKLIFNTQNVEQEVYQQHALKAQNSIARWVYHREGKLIKKFEDQLALRTDEVWALTQYDADFFASLQPSSNVEILKLPSGSTKSRTQRLEKAFDIGLLGSWSWKANQEALQWFLDHIYPHLPTYLSIHIAGKGADWLRGRYPNIEYCGVVPDAQEFMAQAKVVAIPTLRGGGIQIKTLDAIASGSPIVATSIGLRGISNPPKTVQVADTAQEFAQLLIEQVQLSRPEQTFEEAQAWCESRYQTFCSRLQASLPTSVPVSYGSELSI